MAKVTARTGSFPARLKQVLVEGLVQAGIRASVKTEKVPQTKLHRVRVTACEFSNLQPSERQDLVWRIVAQEFSPQEQLKISMILTLTPDESR